MKIVPENPPKVKRKIDYNMLILRVKYWPSKNPESRLRLDGEVSNACCQQWRTERKGGVMKHAFVVLKFVIVAGRFDGNQVNPQQVRAAIPYFPLVGIFLGFILVLLNRLLDPRLESEILGALLIGVFALLTGGIHY